MDRHRRRCCGSSGVLAREAFVHRRDGGRRGVVPSTGDTQRPRREPPRGVDACAAEVVGVAPPQLDLDAVATTMPRIDRRRGRRDVGGGPHVDHDVAEVMAGRLMTSQAVSEQAEKLVAAAKHTVQSVVEDRIGIEELDDVRRSILVDESAVLDQDPFDRSCGTTVVERKPVGHRVPLHWSGTGPYWPQEAP